MSGETKLLFGIVTYREKFWDCASYCSLIKSHQGGNNQSPLHIFIFDNTDQQGWCLASPPVGEHVKIQYHHAPNNPGISVAYNTIAQYGKDNQLPWLVFLDQDTSLPKDFYKKYTEFLNRTANFSIAAPKIYTEKGLMSPSKFIGYRSHPLGQITTDFLPLKNITCINSGLLVNTLFFFDCGCYNEDLRLDFCDHDFIERAASKTNRLYIIPIELRQNFSTETNSKEQALVRYKLFYQDLKKYRRNRNKSLLFFLIDLPHAFKETYRYKTLSFLKIRVGL
ncbi:GT2 family glycosyltransferase [Pedobacter sp. UYEF25]